MGAPTGGGGGGAAVLRGFDAPLEAWGPGHRGVDLAAGADAPVRSTLDGVVSFAGPVGGVPVVVVEHPGTGTPSLRSTYEPVVATVAPHARVTAGQVIGRLAAAPGGPGHCGALRGCLHWGLLRGERYLDPLRLLRRARHARLLPLLNGGGGGATARARAPAGAGEGPVSR
ncbi:peptidoglycan DD-metalloendopeptidase family protein [Phaeacidiphilus oryzae]|uniref:peptidoglycan DD-metalloendopeptidase family protein n=1 Tax=Phaeacidiphilus oryzae TaxID=348818 RepID=UPI001F1DBC79|nr:peptidoglycan DD-metalloendopeptidase family protein [Phaeacidiphilus oryzae]